MPPTLNRTFTKLLTYSIAMVAVPFAAYKLAVDVVLAGQMEDLPKSDVAHQCVYC